MIDYHLRPVEPRDLDLILEWRNRPEIRRNMYTSHVITPEEHHAYFERVLNDPTKQYFLCVDKNDTPVGVVNFVDIDQHNKTASWAFYSGDLTRRGVGTTMEYLALNHAFHDLELEKLNCEVLDFNYPVVQFHLKFGFRIEGIFRKAHLHDHRRADIYRLAIFRADWLKYQQPHYDALLKATTRTRTRLDVGANHETHLTITNDQIHAFAELSGDTNPIHLDPTAAKAAGFKDTVAHGALLTAAISRALGTTFPGPGTILLSQSQEFLAPAYPGIELTLLLEITRHVGRRITINTTIHEKTDPQTTLAHGTTETLVPQELLEE